MQIPYFDFVILGAEILQNKKHHKQPILIKT